MAALKELRGDGPLFTNAHYNRTRAMQMMKAGMAPEDIAREFPEVFTAKDGLLGQKYQTIFFGSGRKETKYMITGDATKKAIADFKERRKAARAGGSKKRASKTTLLTAEQLFAKVRKSHGK
jgi:hypothetical protein